MRIQREGDGMNNDEDRIAEVAVAAARAAGDILKTHASRRRRVNQTGQHDVKLEVDVLSERVILEAIRGAFPDHSILAEESGAAGSAGEYQWIIDPLDGTVNYFYGLPYYCTSVACFRLEKSAANEGGIESLGRPVVGVVYAPPTDDLFVGRGGRGATLNEEPIKAGDVTELSDAILCMGFGKTDVLGRHMASAAGLLADRVRKLRCLGAAAFDLSNVACGRLSGFFEKGLRTWDIAAASVILREAGGKIQAEEYEPTRWRTLAAAPGIFEELGKILLDR